MRSRGQATLPPFEHDVGVGASIARTLNSYGTGAVRLRYLRFGSATADPLDSADHLVGSNLAVAVATGGQGTLSNMMAILPFACDCVWGSINTTRIAGQSRYRCVTDGKTSEVTVAKITSGFRPLLPLASLSTSVLRGQS